MEPFFPLVKSFLFKRNKSLDLQLTKWFWWSSQFYLSGFDGCCNRPITVLLRLDFWEVLKTALLLLRLDFQEVLKTALLICSRHLQYDYCDSSWVLKILSKVICAQKWVLALPPVKHRHTCMHTHTHTHTHTRTHTHTHTPNKQTTTTTKIRPTCLINKTSRETTALFFNYGRNLFHE